MKFTLKAMAFAAILICLGQTNNLFAVASRAHLIEMGAMLTRGVARTVIARKVSSSAHPTESVLEKRLPKSYISHLLPDLPVAGDHTTVSSGPDNDYLKNFACAVPNSMRHDTTAKAVTNFISKFPLTSLELVGTLETRKAGSLSIPKLHIAGHGNVGFFETGYGQTGTPDREKNFVVLWNENNWGPIVAKLKDKNFSTLTIWACHTGAGSQGADLLYNLAKRIEKPVKAPTGLVYAGYQCNSSAISLEPGTAWQVATPTYKPHPLAVPTPPISKFDFNVLFIDDKALGIDEVENLELFKTYPRESRKLAIESKISDVVVKEVLSAHKFEMPGVPAAFVTHKIKLRTSDGPKDLLIYNGRIICDTFHKNMMYVSPTLASILSHFEG